MRKPGRLDFAGVFFFSALFAFALSMLAAGCGGQGIVGGEDPDCGQIAPYSADSGVVGIDSGVDVVPPDAGAPADALGAVCTAKEGAAFMVRGNCRSFYSFLRADRDCTDTENALPICAEDGGAQ